MQRRRQARTRAICLLLALVLLVIAACDGAGDGGTNVAGGPTTTTAPVATTTTTDASTTTTTTTTTDASTTTTTTTAPAGGGGGGGTPAPLTRTDTGLTRVRIGIASQAAWMTLTLHGTHIEVSKVTSTTGNSRVTGLGGQDIAVWGDGTAVIEAVLQIAPGASTYLSMCKNYLGPAAVSIDRMTDGVNNISVFNNSGTSTAVPSGSCENYAQLPLDRAALIGPVRWPARQDPRPLVLANYYPWYDPSTLATTSWGDPPIGPANTNDPAVVGQAVDLAKGSGVDGFIVEWEATPAMAPRIDAVFDAADQRPGFQAGLMIDLDLLDRRNNGLTTQMLDAGLAEVAAHASHPSQLKVNGQPVVFVYGAKWVTASQWDAALDRLQGATGIRPYVIPDDTNLGTPALYQYGLNNLGNDDQLTGWAEGELLQLDEEPGLAGSTGPMWVAPVSPGYDDRKLGRPQPTAVDRNGGVRYDQEWSAALATLPDWVLITSWNEYYEQTHIAPGFYTGYQALQQTTAWAASFHQSG